MNRRTYHSSGDEAGAPSWLRIVHQLRDMVLVAWLVLERRVWRSRIFLDGGAGGPSRGFGI